ncbi:6295_t:CDS:10 [Ambispora gerdemannii]|uniref:6295_t:CDS:1 n=1 Tax=Ambispora gerdemannii TaxID=144530 RepID=A0A9N8WB10_9GLOM|nr:6295_t:CDS:10 [Ambispora gerdemannii]
MENQKSFFESPLFRFLAQPEVLSKKSYITLEHIFAHYQKEWPNSEYLKIYDAFSKDLNDALDTNFYNKDIMNILRNIKNTWSTWKKERLKHFRHNQFDVSVTKYQKSVATVVEAETNKWVEEAINNDRDDVLISNKRQIDVKDVPEMVRPDDEEGEHSNKWDLRQRKKVNYADASNSDLSENDSISRESTPCPTNIVTPNIAFKADDKSNARKILPSFDKLFSSADVKNFIDELELKDERSEFQNVASASTLQALEEHSSTRKAIEDIRNVKEVTISADHEAGQNIEKISPSENVRKRLYSETDELSSSSGELSAHIMSVMEKYCKKQTTSKFDLAHSFILDLTSKSKIESDFEPKLWAELIADRPVTAKAGYYKEIESICDHLFGPLSKKKQPKLYGSRDKWESLRNLKAPEYNDDFSYEKEDWKKILYWAERAVGPFLDAFESEINPIQQNDCGEREWFGDYIIPIFQGALKLNVSCRVPWGEVTVIATARRRNKDKNVLEQQLERGHLADLLCKINQQEIICGLSCGGPHKYDLTKWDSDEYQLPRMLKDMLDDILEKFRSRNRCTSNLYTIGIQGLAQKLSFELDDRFVPSRTPERDPPNEMKTDATPDRSKKKRT